MAGWLIAGAGLVAWLAPFVTAGWNLREPATTDRTARLGMLFEAGGLCLMLTGLFRGAEERPWRVGVSLALFAVSAWLAWWATRTLGRRHLRFDAAVVEGHELITGGPYVAVRHPIYTSFLCAVWAVGVLGAPWWLFAAATAVFLTGTEIRVRAEDRLLAERFGGAFEEYRRSTRAYLPLVR